MNRTLIAAAFAAAMLPAMALNANAASFDQLKRTYTLGCATNMTDGVSLKSGMIIVTNNSPHTIRKGTRIDIVVAVRGFGRVRNVVHSQIAYTDILARATISFTQPLRALSCSASASFQPHLETKIKKIVR